MNSEPLHSRLEFRVRYCETDQMGVVHHPNYFVWFENGRIDLLRLCGVDYAQLEREGQYFPVVTCASKYRRPARFDDRLMMKTVILQSETSRMAFGAWLYNIDEGGEACPPLAKLYSLHAYARGGLLASPFPDDLLQRLTPHVWTGAFFSRRRRPPGF